MRLSALILGLCCAGPLAAQTIKPADTWRDLQDGHIAAYVLDKTLHVQARRVPSFPKPMQVALPFRGSMVVLRIDDGRAKARFLCAGYEAKSQRSFIVELGHVRYEFRKPRVLWLKPGVALAHAAWDEPSRTLLLLRDDATELLWWRPPRGPLTQPLQLQPLKLATHGREIGRRFAQARRRVLLRAPVSQRTLARARLMQIPPVDSRSPMVELMLRKNHPPAVKVISPATGWCGFDGLRRSQADRLPAYGPPGSQLTLVSSLTGSTLGRTRCDARGLAWLSHGPLTPGDLLHLLVLDLGFRSRHHRAIFTELTGLTTKPRIRLPASHLAKMFRAGTKPALDALALSGEIQPKALALVISSEAGLRRLGTGAHRLEGHNAWALTLKRVKPRANLFRSAPLAIPEAPEFWHRKVLLQCIARYDSGWELGKVLRLTILPPTAQHGKVHPKQLHRPSLSTDELSTWMRRAGALPLPAWRAAHKE